MTDDNIEELKSWMPIGSTVYTILRSVSRSGMNREISLVIFDRDDNRPLHPNYRVAKLLKLRQGKRDGIKINGCGMDMGFDLVYRLSHALYGDANALRQEWL